MAPVSRLAGRGNSFRVTVVDGPPVIKVPPNVVAEATSALGALVSYDVTAEDAVSGPLPVECAPSSPAQFQLDALVAQPRGIVEPVATLAQHDLRASPRQQLRRGDPASRRAHDEDAPTDDRERIAPHAITATSALSD